MFNPGAAICGQLMHEEEKARADTAPTETKLNIMDFKFFSPWICFKKYSLQNIVSLLHETYLFSKF